MEDTHTRMAPSLMSSRSKQDFVCLPLSEQRLSSAHEANWTSDLYKPIIYKYWEFEAFLAELGIA